MSVAKQFRTAVILPAYTLGDPVTRNVIEQLADDFERIIVIDLNASIGHSGLPHNVTLKGISLPLKLGRLLGIGNILKWFFYRAAVRRYLDRMAPDLIVTFMLRPLAALPIRSSAIVASCIYDIPDSKVAGKLDYQINRVGFSRLRRSAVVWASDKFKSVLTKEMAGLDRELIICHNCPSLDYLKGTTRNDARTWLENKLLNLGATGRSSEWSIMIRAGAIGPYGGIEETLIAMKDLPADTVFLMLGRPARQFEESIKSLIKEHKLAKRAFIWNNPDDHSWKMALAGADIGHLLHLPPPENSRLAGAFKLNSSLSNNRLFYYMCAGLPILSYDDTRLEGLYTEIDCFQIVRLGSMRNDIVEKWSFLIANRPAALQQGANAKAAFLRKYNWEKQFAPVKSGIVDHLCQTKTPKRRYS